MDAITAAHDGDTQMIDSTSIRVHQQAATAKGGVQITVSVDHAAGSRPKSMFYRERNLIERFFPKPKHFRRVATRYDKLAAKFLAMVQLASIRLWLRAYESTA